MAEGEEKDSFLEYYEICICTYVGLTEKVEKHYYISWNLYLFLCRLDRKGWETLLYIMEFVFVIM